MERRRAPGSDGLSLEQRGMVGDTATAALIAADGAVEWYCPRRFDAPAALFRLLDPAGGSVRVGPAGTGRRAGHQAYVAGSNVLSTVLPAPDGEVEIVDAMPWDGSGERPPGRIVRVATVRRGSVEVEVEVTPGSAFHPAHRVTGWSQGIAFDSVLVRAGIPFDGRRAATTLRAGERLVVTVDLADAERHHEPLATDAALQLQEVTAAAWRRHLVPLAYDGHYRGAVERSLLVLKALTAHGSSAVVAAPTTSLPGAIGGERNTDQRFAWVRDACAAADATQRAGLGDEADAMTLWLTRLLEIGHLPIAPATDADGDGVDEERELALAGWRRSQPVRTGNRAGDADVRHLDHFADLVGAARMEQLLSDGPWLERWPDLCAAVDWLTDHWRDPDVGVWEVRSGARNLVSSLVSSWSALDRMARLARARNPLDLAAVVWHEAAHEAMAELEAGPLGTAAARPPGSPGDDDPELLDAALLRLAWRGPWPATHVTVTRTVDRVLRNLSSGPHVHRYPVDFDDGLPPGEGAFTACSFWAVRALAATGRWEDAHERMEQLCELGRPLGLLSEQADPTTGALLGNLPHVLTHISLVQATLALASGPR